MGWADNIPALSKATVHTLGVWAAGQKADPLGNHSRPPDLPRDVVIGGPASVIDYVAEHFPETDAGRFWSALRDQDRAPDNHTARDISDGFFQDTDWRPGFAISALRALDTRSVWDSDGILLGLEVARGILTYPGTVAMIKLNADLADGGNMETPLEPQHSPFADPAVREVLSCFDAIVAAQEQQADRLPQVLSDMQRFGPEPFGLVLHAQRRFSKPIMSMSGPVGSRVVTLLRALMEDALDGQQLDLVKAIDSSLILLATRYGFTQDLLFAAHRCAVTNAVVHGDMASTMAVAQALEHFLAGALWLGDPKIEATLHHGLGLMLRSGPRKVPGMIDGVRHMQRAISLRHQVGETISALGTQIDLTSLLIQLSPFSGLLMDAPREVANWQISAEAYLEDAIDRLASEDESVARSYLGEAFYNRSRLYHVIERRTEAAESARAALGIAEDTGNYDLKARALQLLGQVAPEPEQAINYQAAAARLVQTVRRNIVDEQITVAWVGNKQGLFDSQLDYVLNEGRRVMTEEAVCEALINALEEGRGLTYNRWLGVAKNTDLEEVRKALEDTPNTVLAVYAVTGRQVGVVLITAGDAPRLHLVDMDATDVDRMMEQHLLGLDQQGWTRQSLWDTVQADFLDAVVPLVAPLEAYVASGKAICIIPHRSLHAVHLHTVPTEYRGRPIGLRVQVFSNPSLTNWVQAQQEEKELLRQGAKAACVAGTWPPEEKNHFGDMSTVAPLLHDAGLYVKQFDETATDLAALADRSVPWQILHLCCHGVFRAEPGIYGLLLAADGRPPPPPVGEIDEDELEVFLATPKRLREAGVAGRITFLSSCVSARSVELPGDDLIGITRAFFAAGAVDLIAGGWTVMSDHVQPFIRTFYTSLRMGQNTAEAMLLARQHLAKDQPDPFFWGCFVHQGANARFANTGGEHVS